jgi:hypothetical protein
MKRLLEVQKEIGTLSKNAKNPFFKSAYLDLTDLLMHVTPLLNAKGLIVLQPLSGNSVGTQIVDSEDGNIITHSFIDIPNNITDPQKLGSCITYFRRYTLKSLLSIAEVDDDGNLAAKPVRTHIVILKDENIESSIKKGTQKELLKGISEGKFSATDEQIKKLK